MKEKLNALYLEMVQYYTGDPKRIQHFIKVHSFAKLIAEREQLPEQTCFILQSAAFVHDIGIRPAEEKYGKCDGKLQEQEGPAPARAMLTRVGYAPEQIDRVCYLIAHHHTYSGVEGMDYRILLEADFLVNLYEDGVERDVASAAFRNIFRTETGKMLCRTMFGLDA